MYVALRGAADRAAVDIEIRGTEASNNTASAGGTVAGEANLLSHRVCREGGVYIHNEFGQPFVEPDGSCASDTQANMSCVSLRFDRVVLSSNSAVFAAGGLFLSGSAGISRHCRTPASRLRPTWTCSPSVLARAEGLGGMQVQANRIEVRRGLR